MKRVITTVGTSIFTNEIKNFDSIMNADYISLLGKTYSENRIEPNMQMAMRLEESLKKLIIGNASISAEIKSILKIQESENDAIEVHLLCTDTILSYFAARIIIEHFKDNSKIKVNSTLRVIEKLNVENSMEFETVGLENLANSIYNLVFQKIDNKTVRYECILNITGGYKGIIPYMTIIGQIMDLPICYIFERTDELITIPSLPIQFDSNVVEKFTFDLQPENLKTIIPERKNDLIRYGLIKSNCKLTGIGKFLTNREMAKMFTSKSILGFTVEDKLYEFYTKKYQNDLKVIHSSTILGNKSIKGAEMDFEIKLTSEDYIAIEVKSSKQLQKYTSFEIQLKCKLELMVKQNKIPSEFHIVIYSANEREYKSSNFLLDEFKASQNFIKSFIPNIIVRIFKAYIKIHVNTKSDNPYTNFMQEGITYNNFKEINFQP